MFCINQDSVYLVCPLHKGIGFKPSIHCLWTDRHTDTKVSDLIRVSYLMSQEGFYPSDTARPDEEELEEEKLLQIVGRAAEEFPSCTSYRTMVNFIKMSSDWCRISNIILCSLSLTEFNLYYKAYVWLLTRWYFYILHFPSPFFILNR